MPHRKPDPTPPLPSASEFALDCAPCLGGLEVIRIESANGAERQLAQLGILAGASLRVVRRAPMGGPILVQVHGSEVAIGRALARRVWVKMR